ncbi:MAG: hypothetical protein Q6373_008610 [Candidatus Sigynarchaeota archaeon]
MEYTLIAGSIIIAAVISVLVMVAIFRGGAAPDPCHAVGTAIKAVTNLRGTDLFSMIVPRK